jgi:acetylglutamate kinase
MKLLIKVGGTLLDDEQSCISIASQLAGVASEYDLVVVHGGGKQVTRYLEERGVQSRFVGGLRVSDAQVIESVTSVIAGSVNKKLVSAIVGAGESAVGISGVDGLLTTAVQLSRELGNVGKPVKTDGRLLDVLVDSGYIPVVACIGGDRNGIIYNVNADQMAVSVALGWGAEALLFLTDVPGVKGPHGEVIRHLTAGESTALIDKGIALGGMQAKLNAAIQALHGGLSEVVIAPGHESNICRRLLAREVIGTRLSLENEIEVKEGRRI